MLRPIASVVEVTYPSTSVENGGSYTVTATPDLPDGYEAISLCSATCSTPMVAMSDWAVLEDGSTRLRFRAFAARDAAWTATWLCLPKTTP